MSRSIAAVLAIATTCFAAGLSAQPPAVSHTQPSAALPGQATDIVVYGGNLAGAAHVWTTLAPTAKVELTPGVEGNGTKADNVSYRVTLPADAPVGIYALRLATPGGVSSPKLFMIDDLPTVIDNGANKTIQTAQLVTPPVAVDGACEAESYDFYKLAVVAGQRISVEVVARRLGSALDPVIRLLDAGGRELAYSDDEGGIGADSRFAYQFAAAGDYYLEIRDIRYQGGGNHRYRLRVGDFPLANTPYPLSGQKGTTPKLAVAGPKADGMPPLNVLVPADVPGGRLAVGAKYPQGQGSAALTLFASSGLEQVEIEPNDTPETATAITLPFAVNGRFETPKDRDYFEIQGKKGERYVISGRTRSMGSPADLFLRLYKADGALLVEAEDAGTEDGVINYTFHEDGVYRLMVEDLLRRGGPEYVYRVEFEPYRPGFTLTVDADKFDAPKGGVLVLKVAAARIEYNGPITLSVVGAGNGIVLANQVIPEGKPDTQLSITLPPGFDQGQVRMMNIVGTAKIGESDFTAKASTLIPLRTLLNGLPYPPAGLDGSIGLGIGPLFADFFQLAVEPAVVPFAQVVGAATFTVKATKLNGFDDPITLAVEGLPPGVTAVVAPIEKGKAEVAIQLAGPGAMAEGDHAFRVVGSATFQNQPKKVAAAGVLRVVKPIEVTAVPAGAINRGATQKMKITVTRNPAATAAVSIKFKNLPAGVGVPAEITIAEGRNEVEIDVTAAADALLGPTPLTLVATTKVKEKTVTVESLPVALHVAMP
ncbi:MAG TPA: PPC domain-containing protein [Pirellulales bacterium]|nr:PPC domain-containing protein [Pirellulales bacterium]